MKPKAADPPKDRKMSLVSPWQTGEHRQRDGPSDFSRTGGQRWMGRDGFSACSEDLPLPFPSEDHPRALFPGALRHISFKDMKTSHLI